MASYEAFFYVMDPGNPPPWGTPLDPVSFIYTDEDGDGFIGSGTGDTIDGQEITQVWVNDTITVQQPDGSVITITGVTFYVDGGPAQGGTAYFVPTDGTDLQDAIFLSSTFVTVPTEIPVGDLPGTPVPPPCYTPGTQFMTPDGPVAVEELQPGDLVCTLDHGPQPVRWVGKARLSGAALAAAPHLVPVRIAAGALGAGLPRRDIFVSPQHRMLLRSRIAERMCDAPEVLAAAVHLVGLPGITRAPVRGGVDYIHLMFDRHEVIFAEGAPSESLYLGRMARRGMPKAALKEILALFPELAGADVSPEPARPLLPGKRARQLAARHARNDKPLLAA